MPEQACLYLSDISANREQNIAQGFSLIQLLLAVLVFAGLLLGGMRSMLDLYQQAQSHTYSQELMHIIKSGRLHALRYSAPTTLCHLSDQQQCDHDWHLGVQLFSDANRNKTLDPHEDILYQLMPVSSVAHLTYNRRYIHFAVTGSTLGSNGRFIYCPVYHQERTFDDARLAQVIVVNRQGRARIIADEDGDGMISYDGAPIHCSE